MKQEASHCEAIEIIVFPPSQVFAETNTPNAEVGVSHQPHCCKVLSYVLKK
jgi:hypothetical protein